MTRIYYEKSKLTSAVLFALFGLSALHAETKITATPTGKGTPKYVFVFVGDGMSYPQIQSAAYYAGKDAGGIVDVINKSENPFSCWMRKGWHHGNIT